MSAYIVKGNYLDPEGVPVLATQMPEVGDNHLGGIGLAIDWCGRWVKAAGDVEVFRHAPSSGLQWDHGTTRHVARLGDWIVWTGTEYRIVAAEDFAKSYADVSFHVDETGK